MSQSNRGGSQPAGQSQTARRGRGPQQLNPNWQTAFFIDHAGQAAQSVYKGAASASSLFGPPKADTGSVPKFSFQVYSTLPLEDDRSLFVNYLAGQRIQEYEARFDFYSPMPDVFACVEHQKHEIRHRKPNAQEASHPVGPIPRYQQDRDSKPQGFLIIITSLSYKDYVQHRQNNDDDPNGPFYVWFDRSLHQRDTPSSLLISEAEGSSGEDEEGVTVHETPEMTFIRIRQTSTLEDQLYLIGLGGSQAPDFGPSDEFESLESSVDSASIDTSVPIMPNLEISSITDHRGSSGTLVKSVEADEPPKLCYLVYPTFDVSEESELSNVAQTFASTIAAYSSSLPSFQIEVYHPEQGFQSAIDHARTELASRGDFTIGFLNSANHRRFPLPQHRNSNSQELLYKTFVVVLDKIDFVKGNGVLFVLADADYDVWWKHTVGAYNQIMYGNTPEIVVLRPSSIEYMVERLNGAILV